MAIRFFQTKIFTSPGWLLSALLILLGALPLTSPAESDPPSPCLFSQAGQELLDASLSPGRGSWQGYGLASGFATALAVGLTHDLDWYQAVQKHRSAWQDKVMPLATLCGDGWFEVGAAAALYEFGTARDRRAAAMAVEGQIDVAVTAALVKLAFTATRPSSDDTHRFWFTGNLGDNSFASGHAMSAFCSAAILGDAYHAEWLTYPLAALVAYSRVYNQNHWPADVIAGAGLGLLLGQTVIALHARADEAPAVHFSVIPAEGGTQVAVIWHY